MKKTIVFSIFLSVISLPNNAINTAVINADDYKNIDKKQQIKIISSKIDSKTYPKKSDFIDFLDKAMTNNLKKEEVDFLENLSLIIASDVDIDKNNLKTFSDKIESINDTVFNYISIVNLSKDDFLNSHNEAWIAKTANSTYLSDEIFLSIELLQNNYSKMEEIISDMEVKFPNYPLNKYNRLLYLSLSNPTKISEDDIIKVRQDIRKINSKFYPELEKYKTKLLMMTHLMQANYYFNIKDAEKLKLLKKKINETKLKENLSLERINNFIDYTLRSLGDEK